MESMKKKIRIEYPLNPASGSILWGAISTPSGLQRWFADNVSKINKTYTFKWGKTETRNAEILNQRTESFIRFHWIDDDPKTYFELKILSLNLLKIISWKLPILQFRVKKKIPETCGILK